MGLFKRDFETKTEVSAVIKRADGTIENLGIIAVTKPDGFFKRLLNLITSKLKRKEDN
jgi:hypothetical protein